MFIFLTFGIMFFFVSIHENPIGDEGIADLVSTILEIHSTAPKLPADDTKHEEQPLEMNTTGSSIVQHHPLKLKMLDIGACGMTDSGAHSLSRLISANVGLTSLSLTGNKTISIEGWLAIGDSLAQNVQLETLEIHHNGLGDRGVAALVVGLLHNKTLRTVDVEGNQIGDVGARRVLEWLRSDGGFRTVYVRLGNDISDELVAEIEALHSDEF